MDVGVTLLPRRAQLSERALRLAVQRQLRHERAGLRLVDQDAVAGELDRADAVEDERVERDPRDLAVLQGEAAEPAAAGREGLDALLAERRVGDDEAAVGRIDVERTGIEHAARFGADLDDLL